MTDNLYIIPAGLYIGQLPMVSRSADSLAYRFKTANATFFNRFPMPLGGGPNQRALID